MAWSCDVYHGRRDLGRMVGRTELEDRFGHVDADVWERADASFPVRVTRSWSDRMEALDDPLGAQAIPRPGELQARAGDVPDPVGEGRRRLHPLLVQKHPDRVLFLVTKRCHLYCRYCFRRDHEGVRDPDKAQLEEALLAARSTGARELILSGGDPLSLADDKLSWLLDEARPHFKVVRIHTRAPITAPWRVTPELLRVLSANQPLWVVVHSNHLRELSAEVDEALRAMVDAGIPVLNQSVLLAGVNDSVEDLQELCEALVERRVLPYYLHHPDPVPGNAAFRVSLDAGWRIYEQLQGRLSGVALPRYVIDPPDGSGKVDVATWVRTGGHEVPSPHQEE